jgi:frataxin-like iron-binding protein CyaY
MATRIGALEAASSSQKQQVTTIEKELVIMEKTTTIAEVQQNSAFDRDLDGTILRVDTHQKTEMALASVTAAVTAWMEEANLGPERFEVLGQPLGNSFVVKFAGDRPLATKRAASAMAALRRPDGSWLDLRAVDADDKQIRLYVNADKNGRMVRMEREGKKLQRAIQEGSPAAKVVFLRRDGVISFNFKAVAKIEVSPDGPTKLLWNERTSKDSGIDQNEVTRKFNESASEPVWTQHCL